MKSIEIRKLLPAVIRTAIIDRDPADALLRVMEELHERSEAILSGLPRYFNSRQTDDRFVPYLAAWLDLDRFLRGDRDQRGGLFTSPIPLDRLREWIAAAPWLARYRGTTIGMRLLLEIATGTQGFQILESVDAAGAPLAFHLRVVAPKTAESQRALLERIISLEKPAYMTFDAVEFEKERE